MVCGYYIDAHSVVCINLWKALCVYPLKGLCINSINLTHFNYEIIIVRVLDTQLITNTHKIPLIWKWTVNQTIQASNTRKKIIFTKLKQDKTNQTIIEQKLCFSVVFSLFFIGLKSQLNELLMNLRAEYCFFRKVGIDVFTTCEILIYIFLY